MVQRRPLARRLEPVGDVVVAFVAGIGDGGVSIIGDNVAVGAVRAQELGDGLVVLLAPHHGLRLVQRRPRDHGGQ